MKIKSIAAICKKNKNIAIFERYSDDGDILTQYIGDGSAVYPVVGLPQLYKESLLLAECAEVCFLPDWKESKGAKYEFGEAMAQNKPFFFFADWEREGSQNAEK